MIGHDNCPSTYIYLYLFIDINRRFVVFFFLFLISYYYIFLSVCTLKYMKFLSDRMSEDAGWWWVQGQPRSWLVDPAPGTGG